MATFHTRQLSRNNLRLMNTYQIVWKSQASHWCLTLNSRGLLGVIWEWKDAVITPRGERAKRGSLWKQSNDTTFWLEYMTPRNCLLATIHFPITTRRHNKREFFFPTLRLLRGFWNLTFHETTASRIEKITGKRMYLQKKKSRKKNKCFLAGMYWYNSLHSTHYMQCHV